MILIENDVDLFTLEEKEILEKKCSLFVNTDNPVKKEKFTNYYVREFINKDDPEFQTIISKIDNCINKQFKKINIKLDTFWINKITNETNKNDGFHKDVSDITFLMYLNEEFTGGEYEYIVETTQKREKLKPKKYLSIITDRTVEHRVTPVLEGERYSMVFFYNFDKKVNKTLI
jgi:hypothetical protein